MLSNYQIYNLCTKFTILCIKSTIYVINKDKEIYKLKWIIPQKSDHNKCHNNNLQHGVHSKPDKTHQ